MYSGVQKKNKNPIIFGTSKKTLPSGDFHYFKLSVCAASNLCQPCHLGVAKPVVNEAVYQFQFIAGSFNLASNDWSYTSKGGWLRLTNQDTIEANTYAGDEYAIDMSIGNLETLVVSSAESPAVPYTP